MEGRLECNKCKKILGGNCFLTKCRHIFCHGDGLSAYNDNGTFTCPVCNAVLDQQTGVTELNLQGERISKNDVNVVLSFLVERPSSSLDFLGQVVKFREFQRQELLNQQDLTSSSHSKQVKELERLNAQYRNCVQQMEGKMGSIERAMERMQTEKKEMIRKYEALDRTYRNLISEQRVNQMQSAIRNPGSNQAKSPSSLSYAKTHGRNGMDSNASTGHSSRTVSPYPNRLTTNDRSPGSGTFPSHSIKDLAIRRSGSYGNTKISPYFSGNSHPNFANATSSSEPLGAFHQYNRPSSANSRKRDAYTPSRLPTRSPSGRSRSRSPNGRVTPNLPDRRFTPRSSNANNAFHYQQSFVPQTPAFKRSKDILNQYRH